LINVKGYLHMLYFNIVRNIYKFKLRLYVYLWGETLCKWAHFSTFIEFFFPK